MLVDLVAGLAQVAQRLHDRQPGADRRLVQIVRGAAARRASCSALIVRQVAAVGLLVRRHDVDAAPPASRRSGRRPPRSPCNRRAPCAAGSRAARARRSASGRRRRCSSGTARASRRALDAASASSMRCEPSTPRTRRSSLNCSRRRSTWRGELIEQHAPDRARSDHADREGVRRQVQPGVHRAQRAGRAAALDHHGDVALRGALRDGAHVDPGGRRARRTPWRRCRACPPCHRPPPRESPGPNRRRRSGSGLPAARARTRARTTAAARSACSCGIAQQMECSELPCEMRMTEIPSSRSAPNSRCAVPGTPIMPVPSRLTSATRSMLVMPFTGSAESRLGADQRADLLGREGVADPDGDAALDRRRHGLRVDDLGAEVRELHRLVVGERIDHRAHPAPGAGRPTARRRRRSRSGSRSRQAAPRKSRRRSRCRCGRASSARRAGRRR